MTRHAPRHANYITRHSNHSLNYNRVRNPWISDEQCAESVLSSSRSLQRRLPAYCTLSGGGARPLAYMDNLSQRQLPYYHHHPNANNLTMSRMKYSRTYRNCGDKGVSPLRPMPPPILVAANQRPSKSLDGVPAMNSGCSASRTSSDRPITPVSASTTDGIVDPCGGYCRTFERCCHYMLQVIFIMGILIGVSLVLAAFWLHNQRRGGDQLVLVYIGVLMALVCSFLLSIQCAGEREVKRKKRQRRASAAILNRNRTNLEVPMRDLGAGVGAGRIGYNLPADEEIPAAKAYCQVPLLYHTCQYQSQNRNWDEMSQSQNGIPWWRRHELEVTSKNDNLV